MVAKSLKRDLIGSILFLSLKRRSDMGKVLKYPPTQVSLSLANGDRSMQKTPKTKLLEELESCIASAKGMLEHLIDQVCTTLLDRPKKGLATGYLFFAMTSLKCL